MYISPSFSLITPSQTHAIATQPLEPPGIIFRTKTYNPNIAENGTIHFPALLPDNWAKAPLYMAEVLNGIFAFFLPDTRAGT
jgi:ubiquitin-protein ligase